MIKEITKVNNIHYGTAAVNGLGENIPEEEVIMIDTEKIETITPPQGIHPEGTFKMRYAGETMYVKKECFEELTKSWLKEKNTYMYEKQETRRMYVDMSECMKPDVAKNTIKKRTDDHRPVTERIHTMTDVFEELGPEHPLVAQYLQITERGYQDEYLITFMQLRMVCEALNEGWHPTFKPGEYRYWPWFWLYRSKEEAERLKGGDEEIFEVHEAVRACLWGGIACSGADDGFASAYSNYAPSYADTNVSSRLCFKTRDLSLHAARNFHDQWLKYYCM